MKKYLIIGLIAIISLELLIQLIVSLIARKQPVGNNTNGKPNFSQNLLFPGNNNHPSSNNITIVGVSPTDGSTNISLTNKVRVTFNKKVSASDISVWLGPDVSYTTDVHDYYLTIIPSKDLTQNTTYYFAVKYTSDQSVSQTYSFTTTGPANPTTNPQEDDFGKVTLSRDKALHPDSYVNYFLPKATNTFYASGSQTNTPLPHTYFQVIIMGNNTDQSKHDFLNYITSLGLTDQQIQQLDIRYVSPQIKDY
ncbi:MAG: Ig-like domain-containing protein [Patescibacteria group bacterium]|nr:Ig-like domain-containing protein [Patescibacteria group bacterium]